MSELSKKVSRDASVHPATVSAFAAGEVQTPRRQRRSRKPPAPAVASVKVHPAVWAAALKVKRPGQRIEIVSATEVRIV